MSPLDLASRHTRAALGRDAMAWLLAVLLASACLLYVILQQFGPLLHQALQVDELFFGACAVRAQVDGWATVAGCHDNKAPLIYLLHVALQQFSHPHDAQVLKLASGVMLALLVGLSARVAATVAPSRSRQATAAAAVLLICALVPSPSLLAVKTEFLGMLFVMLSLVMLPREGQLPGLLRTLGAGVAMGMAVMSKQTFAALLPALAWGLWQLSRPLPWRPRLGRLLAAACGVVLPGLALAALFTASGRLDEFLATTFLYPAVYGNPPSPSLKGVVWSAVKVIDFLQLTPIHLLLVVIALLSLRRQPAPPLLRTVLLQLCLLSLLILMASPALFKYHAIPFWVLSATLGAAWLAEATAAQEGQRLLAAAALATAAILALGQTLLRNDGKPMPALEADAMDPAKGRYLYVLGMEPRYYEGGFMPASSVQFPWALPGTPETWAYRYPRAGSGVQQRLAAQQQRNLAQLYADFQRTPPSYIVVIDVYARQATSPRHADVPGFDEYLAQHCQCIGRAHDSKDNPGKLFYCQGGR